jgi:hypothetical protein
MSHLLRIMQDQEGEDLEKVAEGSDSILVKVACAMVKEGMDGSGLDFPENPVLVALTQQMAQNPEAGAGPYQDLLSQILQADLQNALQKIQMEGTLLPMKIEADRIRAMADTMRARLEGARHMKEMQKMQKEMALEMGMAPQNPAIQATAQMPKKVAPQGPPPGPAGPPGPPAGGPPAGPAPGGGPMSPSPAG